MGNCCCKKKVMRKIILLLVGLDNAGKTVAAKGLAGESTNSVVPTVGFSVVNIKYQSYNVKVYDLGGGPNIRGIWHKYFVDVHGVIFVVDSSDYSRFNEVKMVLEELLNHKKISGKPLLILANKQDQENALDEIDIIEQLDIESLVNNHQCPTLVETCAATEHSSEIKLDPGIKKGFEWLLKYIIRNYGAINNRVETDVTEQEKIDKQEMLEKIERIRNLQELELKKKQDEDAIESYSDYARKLNGEILDVSALDNGSYDSGTSEQSVDSFPPVYHSNARENLPDRPKSAVEIVKQQLQLSKVKKKMVISRSNKTAPITMFGVKPQSAKDRREDFKRVRRSLKSAGDPARIHTDLPNTVPETNSNGYNRELFTLNNFDRKFPPFEAKRKAENGLSWTEKALNGDKEIISFINVE